MLLATVKIQRTWRVYLRLRQNWDFRRLHLLNLRKKSAVRRISYAYRQMKVNKVYNA